jgi:hypothetical protein
VSKQRVDAEMWVEYEEDIISCKPTNLDPLP